MVEIAAFIRNKYTLHRTEVDLHFRPPEYPPIHNHSQGPLRVFWAKAVFLYLPFFLTLLYTTIAAWSFLQNKPPLFSGWRLSAKVRFLVYFFFQSWNLLQFFWTVGLWLVTIFRGDEVFGFFFPSGGRGLSNMMLFLGFVYGDVSGIIGHLFMVFGSRGLGGEGVSFVCN